MVCILYNFLSHFSLETEAKLRAILESSFVNGKYKG